MAIFVPVKNMDCVDGGLVGAFEEVHLDRACLGYGDRRPMYLNSRI
jgi:hypothetical protein